MLEEKSEIKSIFPASECIHWVYFVITGVMGYYQAQLAELIQYPDLRTEVFQSFREVGNAILFCMLVEQALVSIVC